MVHCIFSFTVRSFIILFIALYVAWFLCYSARSFNEIHASLRVHFPKPLNVNFQFFIEIYWRVQRNFWFLAIFSFLKTIVHSGPCRRCRFCWCCCRPVASMIVDRFAPVALPTLVLLPQIVELSSFRGTASTLVLRVMWVYDAFAQSYFLDRCMPGVRVWVLEKVFIVMFGNKNRVRRNCLATMFSSSSIRKV